ncbi:MAG: zinc ABC transporter substrate-binding protein [Candidatus Sumerlaeaceae bacterium]|nr:zinc ABC transporter substrate-binding protein [Candidatus Sumerlaeaceae bacterium]
MTHAFSVSNHTLLTALHSWWRQLLTACVLMVLANASFALKDEPSTSPLQRFCPIAAGNSWLASCLRDLGFHGECIVRVVEPGTCPGHYDIRPSHALRLRTTRASVFFDFQAQFARRLEGAILATTPIIVSPSGGLCVPSTYYAVVEELAAKLSKDDPATSRAFAASLEEIKIRLAALENECKTRVTASKWAGSPVVASAHQSKFCQWLGMQVVATLPTPDRATPSSVEQLIAVARTARARAVIANLQEGTRAAETVAATLHVPLIVFSNFPSESKDEPDFLSLVRNNVDRLLATPGEEKSK